MSNDSRFKIFETYWSVLTFILESNTNEEWDLSTLNSNLVEDITGVQETAFFTSAGLLVLVGVATRYETGVT